MKSPHVLNDAKTRRRQLNQSIADTARQLVGLVRERIDSGGRVSADLVNRIIIDHSYVSVVFADEDGALDIVAWRSK